MSLDDDLLTRLGRTLQELLTISGDTERSRAYLGAEVLANSGSATPPPAGFVQARIDGVAILCRYYGTEPAVADLVDALSIHNSNPIIFQNHSIGLGAGWPFDTAALTVDSADPDADYATIAAAIAVVVADELILFSPETLTSDNQTLIDDVSIAGLDRELSILSTTTAATVLTTGRRNHIFDLSISNEQTSAGVIRGLLVNNIDVEVDNISVLVANAGAGDSYGIEVTANAGARPIFNNVTALADDDGYGLYLADDALPTVIRIVGGLYEGDDAGVFIGNNGTARLFGPIINGIAGAGTFAGLYFDTTGDVFLINNNIILEDNVADALSILDGGGIDYINFVTTNAQPVLVVNQGGVDVDTIIEAVGKTHAIFVRGSDGNVGINDSTPGADLSVVGKTILSGAVTNSYALVITNTVTTNVSRGLVQVQGTITPTAAGLTLRGQLFLPKLINSALDVTTVIGLDARVDTAADYTGDVTSVKTLNISNPTHAGSGTIANLYGLYITNISAGTNDWSIYTNQGLVHFGDQVEIIGSAAADVQLIVKGAAAQSVALLQLLESDNSVMLDSGDGLGGSVFSGNQQLEDIDFVWAGDNEANLFRIDAANNEVRIGDWDTNYFVTNNLGDTWWVGGGGLLFGEIYASDVADTIAIAVAGQANRVQITSFAVNGASNGMTPDHTNDHITILVEGMHLCAVSMSIRSVGGGGADTFGFAVYKNNGTVEFPNLHAHRDLAGGGGDTGSVSLSGIIDLAASDTIEVWVWNEDSTDDIVIDDIDLSLIQIGGT